MKKTRKKLSDVVYTYICDKIMRHEFPGGMPLVESDLADFLGLSRTPVREALKQLEEEGLVYIIPDRGAFVARFTAQDIRETVELRIMFETTALKSCIESVTESDIQECRKLLESISESDELEELKKKDNSLHLLIAKYCQNQRLVDFLETIWLQQERLRWMTLITPKRIRRSKKDHLTLLELIEKRNYKIAARALTKHLSTSIEFITENLEIPNE